MQKFLRTLALMAFLAVPWVTNAQNTLTVADGTATNSNVPIHGLWSDAYLRCQTIYPASMLEEAADAIGMNGGTISSLTYYLSSTASAAYTGTWEIKMTEVSASTLSGWQDVSGATTVYTGTLDATASPLVITFTTPYTYNGGNLLIEVNQIESGNYKSASYYGVSATGASWQGYNSSAWTSITGSAQNFIPKTTFSFTGGQPITCRSVSNLVTSNLTSNSVDLTWADLNNTGATYSIYNGEQLLGTVNAGVYTYSVTGLQGNTEYSLSVVANCSADDFSAAKSVTVRTECDIISSLPWSDSFEDVPSGSYQMPYCWSKYNGGIGNYPYSYNTSYARTGSRALYFYESTYSSYPDAEYAILPQVDVTAYPMNQNMVSFWLVASNLTNFSVEVGTMSDPTDPTTFTSLQVLEAPASTYTSTPYLVKLTNAPATDAYVAIRANKASGYFSAYIDDIVLDQMPSCWPVESITATSIDFTSATIAWVGSEDNDASTVYNVYNGETLVASGVTSPYTLTGLEMDQTYEISVVADCGNNDLANATSITFTHGYCMPNPTSRDGNGLANVTFGTFMTVNNSEDHPQSAPFYGNHATMIGSAILGSESFPMSITWSTGYDYGTIVWIDWNNNLAFEDSEIVYTGMSTSATPSTLEFNVALPEGTAEGNYRVRVAGADSYFDSFVGGDAEADHAPCFTSSWAFAEDYTLYVGPAPEHTVSFNYLVTEEGVAMGTAAPTVATIHWGDSVLLTSTPATNMRTAGWYPGNLTSVEGVEAIAIDTNDLKILVTSDTTITVVYGYGQFEIKGITANTNQARMGSVAGDSPYNNDMYDYATTATLTATANTGFQFIEWRDENGDQYSTENPIAIEAYQPLTLIAHFGIASYEVTAEAEHGHVDGVGTYTFGASATLTAVADDHYHFVRWADDDMTSATRAYRVVGAKTFHPVFEPDVYTVSVNGPAVATYTVKDAEGNETDQFAYTTEATVEATNIDEHYTFVAWNVITYTDRNISIYTNENNGQIQQPGQVVYAIDDEGNTYVYDWNTGEMVPTTDVEESMYGTLENGTWSFSETVQVSTANPYTFAVESDITLTPVYDAEQMTLTIASNDADMGTVRFADYEGTSTTVDFQTQVTIIAEAVEGGYSSFTGWYNGTQFVSDADRLTVTVEQTMTLTAHFEFAQYPVTVAVEPDEAFDDGSSAEASNRSPQFSDNVTFTATAAPHWVFSHWTYAGQVATLSENTTYEEMVFEPLNLVAHFVRDSHTIDATVADATHGTTTVTDENGVEATEPFTHGTYATVSFTADYGYTFAGWENQNGELVSTENPFTFEVTEDTVLTATVSPLPYTVYVDVNTDDEGYIRGAAYVSESDVSFTYDYLTEINAQLTTVPVYGYVFDNWTDAEGNVVELPFALTEDTYLFANFKKDQFEVKGSVAADYRMMGRVSGTATVDYLEYVTLTANENTGYNFVKWVDADGNDIDLAATYDEPTTGLVYDIYTNVNGASIDVLANEAHELFAVYDYETYTVSVAANDGAMGSVTINGEAVSEKVLAYSQTVTLEALPVKHYHFVDWTDGNTENPRTFILNEENAVLYTANFAIDTHTVTFTYNADQVDSISLVPTNSAIAVSATNTYDYNTELQAYIEPAHGYDFMGWSHDGATVADAADTYTFTLVQDTNLMPLFENHQFTVTVASADDAMGTVEGNATVAYQGTTTIKATANYGYDFVNWTNNLNGDVLTDAEANVQVLDDITYTAHFQVHQFTMTALVNDEAMGGVGIGLNDPNAQPVDAEATVADGTNSNSYAPVYGSYMDTYGMESQAIYPATMLSDIPAGSEINSLTFYTSTPAAVAWTGTVEVKLTETANESYSSAALADVSGATTVYTGTLDATGSTMTITFDAPYTYNGGNLLYDLRCVNAGNWKGAYFYGLSQSNASVYFSGSSYGSPSKQNFLPKTTFGYSYVPGPTVSNFTAEATATGAYNTDANFEAQPNYGYHFVDWTNGNGEHFTGNPETVTILRDSTLTANFAKNTYKLIAGKQLNHGATGTVAITGTTESEITVEYLDNVTVTATVAEPYRLLKWIDEDGNNLGTDNPLIISLTGDTTAIAVLDYMKYTVTIASENDEMGTVSFPDADAVPVLTLDAADGTSNSQYVPFDGYNADAAQHNQMIYPASALSAMNGGSISKMVFYIDQSASNGSNTAASRLGTWTVSLGETAATTLTGLDNTSTLTQVYSGNFDCSTGMLTIEFASPYIYNGGNLLVDLNHAASSWNRWYFLGVEATGASYTRGSQRNFLPKVTFTYEGEAPVSYSGNEATADFDYDVNIAASANEHYHFMGWKGANGDTVTALGTVANPTITIAGDSTLTALFDGDQMPMTYQVNNAIRGSVEGPATGEYNTEVTITAVPAHGYEFTAWEDDATAPAERNVTVAGTNEENTYKAIFGFQTYPLEVAIENGTVSVTNDMADIDDQLYTDVEHFDARYYYGSEVELTFTANEHYHFVETGTTTLVKTVSFFEAPEAVNITAVIDTHNVTLAVNDPTLGTIEGAESGNYAYGTELTFTATPAEHQHFVNWSDGVEDAERTITVGDDDITLTANFLVNSYEVIAEADAEQGTADVAGADYGTCNITINAADGYGDGWSGNTINFVQNGTVVDSYSMPNQGVTDTPVEDTYVATVNAHEALSIEWVAGGAYSYPEEIGFTIVDAEGNELYTIADATELSTGDVLATVEKTCPNNVPTVLPNTNVTFTATANPGYEFVNWTNNGEEVSTEASFSMPIVENTTLTANFNFVGFAITVASNNDVMGAAYINNDAEQTTYVAAYEEEVTLNAVPEYGYIFENWTLNGTEVSTEATATVQATAAANYIANFNFDNFDLNVSVAEGQDERGTVTGAGNYPYGTQVEIAAVANDGFLFTTWNDGVTTATRTVTVDGVTEYVASFRTDAIYTVTVIAENGTVSGAGTGFVENDLVSLNAVPATGYRFVNYTDAEGTVLSDNAAYSFNITSDVTLTANFAALPYDVVLNVNDAAMGTVAGAGEYTFGTQVEISATANEGYRFVQWSDDVTTNPRTIVVTADVELTAQFEAIPATVYYIAATAVNGTVEGAGEYEEGDQVTLTATANNCYQFVGWMNGTELVSTANPYVFNATQNLTLMATFEAQSFSGEETQVACESYTWNGQTYTASGDYTATLVSDKGCDSVATLHLTINTPVNVEQTAQACTEYTWTVNNQTYTESGVYTASITDANGCNATATLTLTINDVLTETVVASSCGSYEWNGQTYDATGEYTYTTTGVNGCDSIVTLQLTVNEAVNGGDSTAVACGSFEWNNEFYTQSGDYTINLIAANGCDSTVTLHLTINQAVDVAVYDTACDTYTWSVNNVDYNSTGTYLYTFEHGTATGCDSTVTLYLTINSSVNTTIEATATGSYEWNGTTYTESGEYTFNGQTVNGCDSIVTLLLTIETQTYTVTVNVNNSAMGTVNPAGEITVAAGETFTATAEANEGFRFIGWSNGATTETVTITVESDTTLTANFEAITYTINATANDETMGYVTGSGEYSYGAVVTLEAVANNGYHFVRWSDGTTNAHYEFNAIADVTITAYFEADEPQGIEDVEGADVNIYSADSKIIVKGAENLDIYVYDVNGRVVRTQAAAAETVEFTMNTTGVYLVKVGNAPAKRVVVVR